MKTIIIPAVFIKLSSDSVLKLFLFSEKIFQIFLILNPRILLRFLGKVNLLVFGFVL